jgi:hypothetical protein
LFIENVSHGGPFGLILQRTRALSDIDLEVLMAVPTRSQVEAIIAERIAADPAFRDTLLADPRAVLSEVVGFDIPRACRSSCTRSPSPRSTSPSLPAKNSARAT